MILGYFNDVGVDNAFTLSKYIYLGSCMCLDVHWASQPENTRDLKFTPEGWKATMMITRVLFLAFLVGATSAGQTSTSFHCRCMPFDSCWPSVREWSQFNSTVNGRLIRTIPLAAPCHDPSYNASQCEYVQDSWTQPAFQ